MKSWLKQMIHPATWSPIRRRPRRGAKPTIEILEDRLTPSTSFVVMNAADSGSGSLRDAIAMATTDAGNDTITFAAALTSTGPVTIDLSTVGGTFTSFNNSSNSALKITTPITIQGPSGPNGITIARQTSVASLRLFQVDTGGNLTLENLTLSGGLLPSSSNFSANEPQKGGAVLLDGGTATVQACTVSGNSAVEGGGLGNYGSGTLNVINSTLTGNMAQTFSGGLGGYGGAVYSSARNGGTTVITNSTFTNNSAGPGGAVEGEDGTLQISASTFSGNSANQGGAIFGNNSTTLVLVNCTVSGNTSTQRNGGIYGANLSLLNCTVSGNRSYSGTATPTAMDGGGGIGLEAGYVAVLRNTIVAGNLVGTGTTESDIQGAVDPSSKYNLIGVNTLLTGISNGSNGNQIGIAGTPLNPKLGQLLNNGGPTLTEALLAGSPAINAGDPDTTGLPATDQRGTGFPRVVGGTVDLGAVESATTGPTPQVVTTTADSGAGSLRQAILNAIAATGRTSITFNIATSGVQTITLATPLPAITEPVVIDATTETGFAGTPLVVLDGSQTGGGNGLILAGGGSVVKGLAIDHFSAQAAGLVLSSSGNTVLGDFIGVNAAGTAAAGNYYGIYLRAGATGNTLGGTTTAARNVVSGNTLFGILLEGSGTSGNVIEGNYLGTDVSGSAALPNGDDGVVLGAGASSNTIGGTAFTAGNVISGNSRFGVYLLGSGTTGNVLYRNIIGLNVGMTAKLPNAFDGVAVLSGAAGNAIGSTLGGTTTPAAPLIAGNTDFGILVGANNTTIQDSLIGTNLSNATGLGNGLDGIAVIEAAGATIGGTAANAGNLISGNGRFGVFLYGTAASGNVLHGNAMGVALGGSATLANAFDGVALFGGANGNTIGGTLAGAGNALSGNGRFGVYLSDTGTSGNVVQGNFIGVSQAGTVRANTFDGVALLSGAANNTIGGTLAGAGNTIGDNGRVGILLGVAGTSGNLVQGNFIGTDTTGTLILGNTSAGVAVLTGAARNTIGGTLAGAGNTIANNGGSGVIVGATASDTGTVGDSVLGNAISANGGTGGLGIDLGDNGTTANGSGPSGPNHFQNHPVIQGAALNTGNTVSVNFTLPSLPSSTFRVEFFLNNPASPSQGLIFLGTVNVTTDGTGSASSVTGGGTVNAGVVSVTLTPPSGVTAGTGQSVTATATLLTTPGSTGTPGDTSAFSAAVVLTPPT